jgi:hypothetical protein
LRSQDWSASWNLTNVTVTSAATTAPDGTLTASKIEATTSAATTINQNAAVNATSFSASIYIKKGSGATDANAFKVRNNTTATDLISITVNYDTGAITYVTGSSGATMTALADGWWRLTFVYSGITSGDGVRFFPAFIGGTETANEFCYLWGAQLEAAAFPSSYIPTTTASASRAADVLSIAIPTRTNLALQSQTFDNASWTNLRSSISANTAVAPDGTTTADKLVEDSTATNSHAVQPASGIGTVTATETLSVYAKAAERSWILLQLGANRTAYFNVSAGTIGTTSGSTTATITALANGWYRCAISGVRDTNTNNIIFLASGDGDFSYNGDGTSGIYIWGAQLETGSTASPYIPTTSAAVTVGPLSYPLSLYAEWEKNGDDSVNPYQRVIEVGRASATDQAVFYHRAVNNSSKLYSRSGGVAQADMDVGTSALNTTRKMAGRFATNDFAASLGGAAVVYDTSGSVPATPQNVYFGHEPGGVYILFGYLRRAALWTRALTDAELQSLTT